MTSTSTMIEKLSGMLGTHDLTPWEAGFIASLVERREAGQVTRLTDAQVTSLERLYQKHFA